MVRLGASGNRGLGYGPANISARTLPISLDQLLIEMRRYQPHLPLYDLPVYQRANGLSR
jgi:hypothetical protein